MGPLVIIATNWAMIEEQIFLVLAILSLLVWIICAVTMFLVQDDANLTVAAQQPKSHATFMKSLLYNQVPLRAFVNARSLLAEVTLIMTWICATFILPFYAIYATEKGVTLVSC